MKIVLCVGDSKTKAGRWGTYEPLNPSYPYFLQKELGNDYIVKQMGEGGTCMSEPCFTSIWDYQNSGNKSYTFSRLLWLQQYKSTFNNIFKDDLHRVSFETAEYIIVTNFGTNDAGQMSIASPTFKADYKRYLDIVEGKHYICLTQPTFNTGHKIDEVNTLIQQVANETGTSVIDLNTGCKEEWFPDGVHLNADGDKWTAEQVEKEIKGTQPPIPPVDNEVQKNKIIGLANQIIVETKKIK